MRFLFAVLMISQLCAQVPRQDSRNTDLPGSETHYKMPEYRTPAEWEARREHLRKQVLSAAGLMPMPEKTPLHAQIFGRIENRDYSIEKVLLETRPGYYLGGNLYRPLGKSGKFPGVASPHGHWNYGRLENQQLASIPARGVSLARQGYVAFTYDMVGYNDTIQTPHRFGNRREQLWSFGSLGLQLWNSIRVVDFLQSLPDVDPERIGVTGASGGGTQSYLLYTVDARVKFAAPVNMISAIYQGGCICENAPNLRVGTNNLELGATLAPRPLMMVAATGDWTRNTPRDEFPAIQGIYKLLGKPENVEMWQQHAEHNYNQQSREAVYRFFGKFVLGDANAEHFRERTVRIEGLQDMLALDNRRLPDNAVGYEQLFNQWVAEARRQNAAADAAALRERLAWSLLSEWPARVLSEAEGEHIALSRAGTGDRVSGLYVKGGAGQAVLVVHPDGAEAARKSPVVENLIHTGNPVLMIDAFQTGPAVAPRKTSAQHFLTFNKTADANRVQDILTALAFLNRPKVRLIGLGKAGVWCLFAAAASSHPVELQADLGSFAGTDDDFLNGFFVPGIQRAGGLDAAKRLAGLR